MQVPSVLVHRKKKKKNSTRNEGERFYAPFFTIFSSSNSRGGGGGGEQFYEKRRASSSSTYVFKILNGPRILFLGIWAWLHNTSSGQKPPGVTRRRRAVARTMPQVQSGSAQWMCAFHEEKGDDREGRLDPPPPLLAFLPPFVWSLSRHRIKILFFPSSLLLPLHLSGLINSVEKSPWSGGQGF